MKKETKVVNEYILTETEMRIILHAVDYLHHRIKDHGKFPGSDLGKINDLRKELRFSLNF